ncbi:TPA: hypothetical protein U2L33_001033 [Burkholderia cenocepacia]|nr:hypothetical protein [Burkholderia cenocepacia]
MKDIDEIRRDNLRLLEKEAGSATAAANLLNMSLAQYTNLRDGAKDSKTGNRRGMRKATARRIDQAARKPAGWLDIDHRQEERAEQGAPAGWDKLDAFGRTQVEAFIKGLLSRPQNSQQADNDDRPSGD